MTTFKVGELLAKEQGSRQREKLDTQIAPESGTFEPVSNLAGELELMRITDGIHVLIRKAAITVRLICNRCNEAFENTIPITGAERVFYMRHPSDADPDEEILRINMKDQTIDLTNMLREEILLHFPSFPVCSKSCQGLCRVCGANLNSGACDCPEPQQESNKPLSILKDL